MSRSDDSSLQTAGPIPFIIRGQSPGLARCLRATNSSYYSGQPVVFTTDCTGAGALWRYSATTQFITHYASGLCLSPSGLADGSPVLLASACNVVPGAPSAQVQSSGGGLLQLVPGFTAAVKAGLGGGSCLQPALGAATEGAQLLVNSSCLGIPAEQYYFQPAASKSKPHTLYALFRPGSVGLSSLGLPPLPNGSYTTYPTLSLHNMALLASASLFLPFPPTSHHPPSHPSSPTHSPSLPVFLRS